MQYICTFAMFMFTVFLYFFSCHDIGGFWCLSDFCTRQLLFIVVHPGMCNQILSGVQNAGIHAIMINCILFTACTCKIWYTCRFCWCQRKRGKERSGFTNVCGVCFLGAERLARWDWDGEKVAEMTERNSLNIWCFPKDPITLSEDDWGVQSPQQSI